MAMLMIARHTNTTATATGRATRSSGFSGRIGIGAMTRSAAKAKQSTFPDRHGRHPIISFKINNLQAEPKRLSRRGFNTPYAPANNLEALEPYLQPAHQPHRRCNGQQLVVHGPFPVDVATNEWINPGPARPFCG